MLRGINIDWLYFLNSQIHTLKRDHSLHTLVLTAKVHSDGSKSICFLSSPGWCTELMQEKDQPDSPASFLVKKFTEAFTRNYFP